MLLGSFLSFHYLCRSSCFWDLFWPVFLQATRNSLKNLVVFWVDFWILMRSVASGPQWSESSCVLECEFHQIIQKSDEMGLQLTNCSGRWWPVTNHSSSSVSAGCEAFSRSGTIYPAEKRSWRIPSGHESFWRGRWSQWRGGNPSHTQLPHHLLPFCPGEPT